MRGARIWYRSLAICAFVLGMAALPVPGYAQTGQVKGKVVDASGKPVAGVEVTIAITEGTTRKFTVKTNKNGEYIQIGLQVGQYTISTAKDNMADSKSLRIGLDMAEVNLTLKPGGAAGGGDMSDADRKKAEARNTAVKTAFDAGVAAANAGKADEAVAKFNEVLATVPKCMECYTNIASVYSEKKEYGKAEEALKKAAEVNPASAEPYMALMNLYNTTKRLKEAQEMGAEAQKRAGAGGAGGGASADTAYSQAVVAWNADDAAKAKEHLDVAIKANPTHAEAHFLLAKVYVKLGAAGDTAKLGDAATEYETYLKLAPNGPNAKEAQTNFEALKSFRK